MTAPATVGGARVAPRPVPQYSMLGIRVGAYDIPRLNACIGDAIASGSRIVIANHNLHSLYLCARDGDLRAFHATADVTHADGMSVILLGRMLGVPLSRANRVTYNDWIGPLMTDAARHGWRVFSLGGAPGVFEAELNLMRTEEWARTGDDALWRRSKLGLHLTPEGRDQVRSWFGG